MTPADAMTQTDCNTAPETMGDLQMLLRDEFGRQGIESTPLPAYLTSSLNPAMRLRDYQAECFRYFITYWEKLTFGKEAQPHLLFHMATGSGKTLIMAGLMLYLYEKGYRNFLFFVSSTNIIDKTRDNLTNPVSPKYLFAHSIDIDQRKVVVRPVDDFGDSRDDCINLCLTTTQGLHSALNSPCEGGLTYDDFASASVVMISDEAHHVNVATKRGGKGSGGTSPGSVAEPVDWESTVMRIFHTPHESPLPNVLLDFTATEDLTNPLIAAKYRNKVIFDYSLKRFRKDRYSKEIEVVQSDLPPIERALQAVVLSQYKRKLFASIGQEIKPVMLLKSKRIADNKVHYEQFVNAVSHMTADDLSTMRGRATGDLAEAFAYFEEKGITADNLLLELREDFKADNLLVVDGGGKSQSAGGTIPRDKQLTLNTLESPDNMTRVVFAVDMLNEGWDVLNLFDIVRLYDTRDSKDGRPGKTTMTEAQLIGRGARYMPFKVPGSTVPADKRKFDEDITNRLCVLEKLHYHSSHNPRYIQELHTALVTTGIIPESTVELNLTLKEDFKKSRLYREGYVLANKCLTSEAGKEATSLGDSILSRCYKVVLDSGTMQSESLIDAEANYDTGELSVLSVRMIGLGCHVVRAAVNRFECYHYDNLSHLFPRLRSIDEFIMSASYLAGIDIMVYGGGTDAAGLTQRQKLSVAIGVLSQIKPLLPRVGISLKGSEEFVAHDIRSVFKDHVIRVSIDSGSGDGEYGRSMNDSLNPQFRSDLGKCIWHAYNDCYGTSEEKHLVKYFESIYPRLREKYEEVYLLRNEHDLKLWDFDTGAAFEPDYVLLMRRRGSDGAYDNIQIFIEPKGRHLRDKDASKQRFLMSVRDRSVIHFSTHSGGYEVWGMPFFSSDERAGFDASICHVLNT